MEANGGYIYILFNEMFNFYGTDVFKIGKAMDVGKRMNGYTTSYIKPVEIKFMSEKCINHSLAEQIIFDRLLNFRMKLNRDFFKGDLSVFIQIIEDVINRINTLSISAREKIKSQEHHIGLLDIIPDRESIIEELISKLGFRSLVDTTTEYNKEDLLNKINSLKDTNIFTHDYMYYKLFSSSKSKLDKIFKQDHNLKSRLGYINSALTNNSLRISNVRIQEREGNKTSYYKLAIIDNEILNEDQLEPIKEALIDTCDQQQQCHKSVKEHRKIIKNSFFALQRNAHISSRLSKDELKQAMETVFQKERLERRSVLKREYYVKQKIAK